MTSESIGELYYNVNSQDVQTVLKGFKFGISVPLGISQRYHIYR